MYLRTEMETAKEIATAKSKPKKKKPRIRPLPLDVTSRNLAIEKRRRQDMNRTFLDLARCLPKLASTKRLTKNLIVTESLHYHRQQRSMCIAAGREVRELLAAHNNLVFELNTMRSQLGIPLSNAQQAPSTALLSLMDVENQAYGEFSDGFGSPGETDGQESSSTVQKRDIGETVTEVSSAPEVVRAEPTSSRTHLPVSHHECNWLPQTSGTVLNPPNAQGGLLPNTDWWGFDVPGLDPDFLLEDMSAQTLLSEDMSQMALYGYPAGDPLPFF